jgi:hypothetical protein
MCACNKPRWSPPAQPQPQPVQPTANPPAPQNTSFRVPAPLRRR